MGVVRTEPDPVNRGSGTVRPGPGGAADDLLMSLKRAAAALRDAGIDYALAGGFAAYAHGAAVSTHDVDFVVRERDVPAALDALRGVGMTHVESPENWLEKVRDGEHLIDLIHTPSGRPVDGELLGRAREMTVGAVFMPVLPATDLMIMRLLAYTETACDFSGFLHVCRALREQVDWRCVAAETAGSPYAYAFLTLLARLGVIDEDVP
ncbi:MAG TPA: nucleotidyltransferase [Spirillospora sp.]